MTFRKPHNITLTQMAQWVDANSYAPDRNNDLLVEYLYHLIYNASVKASLFTDADQTDDFALYCVMKFIVRFDNPKEPPVKSVTNYLKIVLSPWRAEYIRELCSGSAEATIEDMNINDFSDYLVDASSEYDYEAYNFYCFKLSDVILQHLKKIPRKRRSGEWSNIYTSCLLTLQDRIKSAVALCDKDLAHDNPQLVNRIIRGLKTKPPILYHIEETQAPYISVLVNEIIHGLAMELTRTTHSKVSVSTCLQNLMKAANNDEEES